MNWERWRLFNSEGRALGEVIMDGDPDHYPFARSYGGDMRYWRVTGNCWGQLVAQA